MRPALALVLAILLPACATQPDYRAVSFDPPTVEAVDLARYAGVWHEIARYPNRFQTGCTDTTATYTLRADDRIAVVNRCILDSGKENVATGRARVAGGSGSKLKVSFAPAFIPFAEGDYWIFHLAPDYSVALVGEPEGKYLWLLARDPDIDPAARDRALQTARDLGFETEPLVWDRAENAPG